MITYNNIVSKFEEFAQANAFIKTFSHGSPSDVDLNKLETFPLMHLVYTGGTYADNIKTYNLEVYILDNPPKEDDKTDFQKSAISQCEMVAEDILADIKNGGNIFTFGYHYELQNAAVTPLEEERSNVLSGTLLSMTLGVTFAYDACNAPLTGVDPEGSITPSFKARGLLRVREVDGDPDVVSVATINVPDGSLTDDGDGEITLTFGGGGDADAAQKVNFPVRNETGTLIPAGTPLCSQGEIGTSGRIRVTPAVAGNPLLMPAIGLAETDLEAQGDGRDGYAMIVGTFNVNIPGFNNLQENQIMYVATNGGLSQAKPPEATTKIQNVGLVLKTNGSVLQGLKVSCVGRANDLPNISAGRFFMGSAANRPFESVYGLPMNEPNDGDILVYNDTLDRFDAQAPGGSEGLVSTFEVTSTNSDFVSGGASDLLDFGSVLALTAIITQTLRAGWVLGFSSSQAANNLQCLPLSSGTTIELDFSVEVRAAANTLATIAISTANGMWTGLAGSIAVVGGNGVDFVTYSFTTTDTTVALYQLASSLQIQINVLSASAGLTYRNPNLSLTVTHA